MLYAAILILSALAGAGATSCSYERTCESCISNKACAYVLGQYLGEESNSYMCVSTMDSRNGMTVSLRIRHPAHCGMTDDVTTECPSVPPLMMTFFILSLLLAAVVSVVTTIACWIGCCGDKEAVEQFPQQSWRASREHELAPTV